MTQHVAYIGLGSNLGDAVSQVQRAFADLGQLPKSKVVARSSLYRSAPVGYLDQPDFVNAVVKLETTLSPQALLQALLEIEHLHGRERTFRNAPRILDLDVLLYDDLQFHEHGLTIPHPRMHERAFVLRPLLEIATEIDIPAVGSAKQALQDCQHQVMEQLADVL